MMRAVSNDWFAPIVATSVLFFLIGAIVFMILFPPALSFFSTALIMGFSALSINLEFLSTFALVGGIVLAARSIGGLLGLMIASFSKENPESPVISNTAIAHSTTSIIKVTNNPLCLSSDLSGLSSNYAKLLKQFLRDVSLLNIKTPGWKEKIKEIRSRLNGHELELIGEIEKFGIRLINEMVYSKNSTPLKIIAEKDFLKKIQIICHSDQWKSPYADKVSGALQKWVDDLNNAQETKTLLIDQNAILRETVVILKTGLTGIKKVHLEVAQTLSEVRSNTVKIEDDLNVAISELAEIKQATMRVESRR